MFDKRTASWPSRRVWRLCPRSVPSTSTRMPEAMIKRASCFDCLDMLRPFHAGSVGSCKISPGWVCLTTILSFNFQNTILLELKSDYTALPQHLSSFGAHGECLLVVNMRIHTFLCATNPTSCAENMRFSTTRMSAIIHSFVRLRCLQYHTDQVLLDD